jgi:DNA-binding transcriptional LysR family regulator
MQINIATRDLRAFVLLAQHKSFTQAAGLCHLSQPAFSALIRALETQLGTKLFDRTTRQVELTVEGLAFLSVAEKLLNDTESAVSLVRDHVMKKRGRVALALLPSLAAGWLPALLARFHAEYPAIELDVADVLSEVCINRIRTGESDLAIAATRSDFPDVATIPFCTDHFHVVCHKDHPLASTKDAVSIDQIKAYPMIHLARSSSVRQYVDRVLFPGVVKPFLELEQLATVAAMVRQNLGITLVPSLTLFQFQDASLHAVRLHGKGLSRQLFMAYRADRTLSHAAQSMRDWLMAQRPA